jgi:hypothetical protein
MRVVLVPIAASCLVALGCGPQAAAPPTPPEAAAPTHDPVVATETGDPATEPGISEGPRALGFAPGEVAVVEWVRESGQQGGHAELRLPTGELLQGHWTEQDNSTAGAEGRVVATDPHGDPGDPTSMPTGPAPASQFVIEMEGDRGTRVDCTIPTGRRSKTKTGKCHTTDARSFAARLR